MLSNTSALAWRLLKKSAATGPAFAERAVRDPVARDVAAPADPDAVVALGVVEEARQPADAPGPADQAAVHGHGQHLGRRDRHVGVERVEGVGQVAEESLRQVEALGAGEAAVVGSQRMADDQVGLAADGGPIGQLVVAGVAVVEEAALLDHQGPGVRARAPGVLAERALAGQARWSPRSG